MKCLGFRGGYDKEKSAGVYTLHQKCSSERKVKDEKLWNKLPNYNSFLFHRFYLFTKDGSTNSENLMKQWQLPSWDNSEWNDKDKIENRRLFSNVSITYNDFHNHAHCDNNSNNLTYGLFSYIDIKNGNPVSPPTKCIGHSFSFPDYNLNFEFGLNNGIIELIWPSKKILHQTTKPPLEVSTNNTTTHFGCSFQISNELIKRVKKHEREGTGDFVDKTIGRAQRCAKYRKNCN
ncbi:hypothetical protein O181_016336 [Austropuccinia psidii MF-1]|uniref:Tet-like 2OG-Fe(II) oxygenase domain-containing protein n=1 Tax=Austropuccinia psidii MF-1 TaxID=1389203 RepID=A0A9Q3GQY3_9BASI|nr:hypothetical protein [Austropuccinia psidii MF-1]